MISNNSITINQQTYDIIKIIGSGTYGKVYLVKNTQTQIQYALKQQSSITQKELEVLYKFKSITFLNVVNTIEILQIQKYWYILMEYCEKNLYEYLNEIQNFNNRDIRYVMQQITNGVMELHSYGLIHRDIKPENILRFSIQDNVTKQIQYTYKLCDLGLVTKEDQAKTAFVGTPYYLAPELLMHNQKYSQKVDIWALGALMYELLTGDVLFNGRMVEEIYQAIKQDIPSNKILQITKLDSKYQNLMISMLNKNPEDRPDIYLVANQLKSFFAIKSNINLSQFPYHKENIHITRDVTPQNTKSQPIVRGITPLNSKNPQNITEPRGITPLNPKNPQIAPQIRGITPMNLQNTQNISEPRGITPLNPKNPQIAPQIRGITPMNLQNPQIIPQGRGITPMNQKSQITLTNQGAEQKNQIETTTKGNPPLHPKPQPTMQLPIQRQCRQLDKEDTTRLVRGVTPMIIQKQNEKIIVVKENELK